MAYPMEGLPQQITIYEVGPRDGLQNESSVVPVEVKAEFIDRLADAGHKVIEATSFVHPKWVPQLADADELLSRLDRRPGVRYPVLVPNQRGLDRALDLGVEEIAIFASATETFAAKNLNRSLESQFGMFEPVVARALDNGVKVRAYVSMCFGDPWEGPTPIQQVVTVGERLLGLGCHELSLGDTTGVGTPGHVTALIRAFGTPERLLGLGCHELSLGDTTGVGTPGHVTALIRAFGRPERLAVHFHDTYGQALGNTLAALRAGVTTVDASTGGIGGCPYAESATGNLATEDLVWMLRGLGIETGLDLDKLVATSTWLAGLLGRPSPSRVVQALSKG